MRRRCTTPHRRRGGCTRWAGRSLAIVAIACTVLGLAAAPPCAADEVRIGGTGNALGTLRLLADAFNRSRPGTEVRVLASLGSSGALKAVPRGALEIGVASRAVNDDERAAGLASSEYARSPTVFAVARKTRVAEITRRQVADIYTGQLANWPDGSAIRPVLRQPGDDNTRQLKALSPEIEQALALAEQRPGLAVAVTDQDAADKIESIPGALGVSTLALIRSEGRALTALKLDGVEPTIANGKSGAYPIVKRFYFITRAQPTPPAQQFIDYVASPAGREILTQTGNWVP